MKRLFAMILALLFLVSLVGLTYAEETTIDTQTTENATNETNAPTSEENEPVDDRTPTEFFDTVVMPLILGIGSGGVISVGALLALLKMWGRWKDAVSKARELKKSNKASEDELSYLKDLLSKIDVNEVKKELDESVAKAKETLKIDEAMLSEMVALLENLKAMQENFMKAAQNAWSASPAAVELLTGADNTAIKAMAAKITAYETYIRTEKGAEAENIIHEIEGV